MSLGPDSLRTNRGRIESELLLVSSAAEQFRVESDRIIAGACPLSPLAASRVKSVSRSLNEVLKDANSFLQPAVEEACLQPELIPSPISSDHSPPNPPIAEPTKPEILAVETDVKDDGHDIKDGDDVSDDENDDDVGPRIGLSHILLGLRSKSDQGMRQDDSDHPPRDLIQQPLRDLQEYSPRGQQRDHHYRHRDHHPHKHQRSEDGYGASRASAHSAPLPMLHQLHQKRKQEQEQQQQQRLLKEKGQPIPAFVSNVKEREELITTDVNDNDLDALRNHLDDRNNGDHEQLNSNHRLSSIASPVELGGRRDSNQISYLNRSSNNLHFDYNVSSYKNYQSSDSHNRSQYRRRSQRPADLDQSVEDPACAVVESDSPRTAVKAGSACTVVIDLSSDGEAEESPPTLPRSSPLDDTAGEKRDKRLGQRRSGGAGDEGSAVNITPSRRRSCRLDRQREEQQRQQHRRGNLTKEHVENRCENDDDAVLVDGESEEEVAFNCTLRGPRRREKERRERKEDSTTKRKGEGEETNPSRSDKAALRGSEGIVGGAGSSEVETTEKEGSTSISAYQNQGPQQTTKSISSVVEVNGVTDSYKEERGKGKEKKSKHKKRSQDKRSKTPVEGEEGRRESRHRAYRDCVQKKKSRRDSHQRGDHLASGLASGGLPPRGLASRGHEEDDDEVVVLDLGTDKDDPTDSTKAPTDSATHPDVDGCSDNGEGAGGGSIVFLGMDGPSDNLRSSTAVNMHQRKWKRSVDYIGNWMVAKCPHDMMVESHDVEPAHETIGDDVIVLSPDAMVSGASTSNSAAVVAANSSRKRHRQDQHHHHNHKHRSSQHQRSSGDPADGLSGGGGVIGNQSNGSAFFESFYNDQHLKRMKLNDETAASSSAVQQHLQQQQQHQQHPSSSSAASSSSSILAAGASSSLHPSSPRPPSSSSATSPFSSSSSSPSSSSPLPPEEVISSSGATHVIIADLDIWGRTLCELAFARPLPSRAFLYGFSSSSSSSSSSFSSSGGVGGFDSLLSSSSQAADFFRQLVDGGRSLLHRQPEFGVDMTLRYQAARLDVLLDVGFSFTILPGSASHGGGGRGGGGGFEEIRKLFAFNAMRNRRNVALFDPNNFSHFDFAQRISANANIAAIVHVTSSSASAPSSSSKTSDTTTQQRQDQQQQQQQQQPIVIDP